MVRRTVCLSDAFLSIGADLTSPRRVNFGPKKWSKIPERVFAVFCSVETFLSEVCVSEVIVFVTSVI